MISWLFPYIFKVLTTTVSSNSKLPDDCFKEIEMWYRKSEKQKIQRKGTYQSERRV